MIQTKTISRFEVDNNATVISWLSMYMVAALTFIIFFGMVESASYMLKSVIFFIGSMGMMVYSYLCVKNNKKDYGIQIVLCGFVSVAIPVFCLNNQVSWMWCSVFPLLCLFLSDSKLFKVSLGLYSVSVLMIFVFSGYFKTEFSITERISGEFMVLMVSIVVYCFREMNDLKIKNLINESVRDPMTKLYNRGSIDEFMNYNYDCVNRGVLDVFSVLMIDIDFFKKINDNYGHKAGDIVIKDVAKILIKTNKIM